MPGQFIKVKETHGVYSKEAFSDTVKKQDLAKWDTESNYSSSIGDICRICHCEADAENALLSPCYCSGSLKYVHQNCLRQWLAASDTRSCELCKFNFILHTKIKPLSEWRILEMSSTEKRRLLCAMLFHFVAAVCVVWSLFVLIDRAAEEVQKGLIAWPFWTKLVVVAVGFTGGAVFMYIQCRQYLHLFSRWRAHNRIILVQNAPEQPLRDRSPNNYLNTATSKTSASNLLCQVVTQVEFNVVPPNADTNGGGGGGGAANDSSNPPQRDVQVCYVFEDDRSKKSSGGKCFGSCASTVEKADVHVEDLCETTTTKSSDDETSSFEYLKLRDTLVALDIECPPAAAAAKKPLYSYKTDHLSGASCKSLPNLLSSSNDNLLV